MAISRYEQGLQSFGPNRKGLIQRDKTTKRHLNAETEGHVVFYTPLSGVPSRSTQDIRHYLVLSLLFVEKYTMDYASRLANLNLSSLEYRRVYFDLTMCYKIVNKLLDIDAAEMFTVISNVHSTRGNSYRLQSVTIPRHDFRLYFFSSRVVPIWNSLPQHVVSAKNIITFMCRLKTVDLSPFCRLYPFK